MAHYVSAPGWFLTDDCESGSLLPLSATSELQEARLSDFFRMPEHLGMKGDLRWKGQASPGVTGTPSYTEGEQVCGEPCRVLTDAYYYYGDGGKWYGIPAALASENCNAHGGHMQLVLPDGEPETAAFFETDQRYVRDGDEIELPAFTVITADRIGLVVQGPLSSFLKCNAFML